MQVQYMVEIRGRKSAEYFTNKDDAMAYAITGTAWTGGQYRITPVFVNEPVEEAKWVEGVK